jgi:predicted ArsR family transcriptional regulator
MAAQTRANGVTVGAVLAYLQREADLDGLVTVSSAEIGEEVGTSGVNAAVHLRALTDAGLISPAGRVKGVKGHPILAYQLSDEVMDA